MATDRKVLRNTQVDGGERNLHVRVIAEARRRCPPIGAPDRLRGNQLAPQNQITLAEEKGMYVMDMATYTIASGQGRGIKTLTMSALALMAATGCTHLDHTPHTIHADVVALDHEIVYNRFGSMNPYFWSYSLRR